MVVNTNKRTPPINPGTGETAWVYWGGCDLSRGQMAAMMIVERVTMNPAPPSSCAPACSRDDSQQETGDPETHQCTAGGGSGSIAAGRTGECSCPNLREKRRKMQENNAARSRKAENKTQKKETPGNRTEKEKPEPRNKKAATRPRRKKIPETPSH